MFNESFQTAGQTTVYLYLFESTGMMSMAMEYCCRGSRLCTLTRTEGNILLRRATLTL